MCLHDKNLSFKLNLCSCFKQKFDMNRRYMYIVKKYKIFSSCSETSTNLFYIFRQYMNIVFILQYHECIKKKKKLHTKGKINIGHFGRRLIGCLQHGSCSTSVFCALLYIIVVYRRLYTSSRHIQHIFICLPFT